MGRIGFPEFLMIVLLGGVLFLFPWSRIFRKAGYPPWLSIAMLVPGLNLAMLFWFAFADWPNLRRE